MSGDTKGTLRRWFEYGGFVAVMLAAVLAIGATRSFEAGNAEQGRQLLLASVLLGTVLFGGFGVSDLVEGKRSRGVGFCLSTVGLAAVSAHLLTASAVWTVTPLSVGGVVCTVGGFFISGSGDATWTWAAVFD